MKHSLWLIIFILFISIFTSCNSSPKEYQIKFVLNDEIIKELRIEENQTINESEIPSIDGLIDNEQYELLGWYLNDTLFDFNTKITSDLNLIAEVKIKSKEHKLSYQLSYDNKDYHTGDELKVKVIFASDSETPKLSWSVNDKTIGNIRSTKNNQSTISLVSDGKLIITVKPESEEYNNYSQSIEINILPEEYNLVYDLKDVQDATFITEKQDTYNKNSFPLTLPKLQSNDYYFLGWKINNSDKIYSVVNQDDFELYDLRLTACFVVPSISINNDLYQISSPANKYLLSLSNNFNEDTNVNNYEITINDESVITYENGYIVGQRIGTTTFQIIYNNVELSNTSFGITVVDNDLYTSNDFKTIISKCNLNPFYQNIMVYGWQKKYEFDMLESISTYLFEELEIIENIAPISNVNRPGTKATKYYICVHDTGDAEYTAKEWSDTVYKYYNAQTASKYDASYQYVVGNDGIYHNIPDDEVAWHAGDGTSNPYQLFKTGVYGTNKKPTIGIDSNGFYTIDNQSTLIEAPKNGNEILTSEDINDVGIRVVLDENNEYLIGNTYFNKTYYKISNYGGNINSIGIESCINYGSDIYYTWQKLAKLVAHLMYNNDLTIDDVVPHHYFSGKNCPQTIRENDRWEYFKQMIVDEYDILLLLNKGIEVSINSNSKYVNNKGRVIEQPQTNTLIDYDLTIKINDTTYTIKLYSLLSGSNNNKII